VHDAVGLVEALGGAVLDVLPGLLVVVEAGDVRRLQVDLGLAEHHPLRDCLADSGPFLDPDGGDRPEVLDLGCLAEQRQAVRGERQQPVDGVLLTDRLVADDLRHQLEGLLVLQLEVFGRERKLSR
jgi:hypothetical protein